MAAQDTIRRALVKSDIEWLRVYPPLGIARVGNADPGTDSFVIGTEVVGGTATLPDGSPALHAGDFRNDAGEIKRQAARFRIYAGLKSGTVVELTALDCDIEWSVTVANLKAGWYEFNQAMDLPRGFAKNAKRRNANLRTGASRSYLDITPAPRQISGANVSGAAYDFNDGSFWGEPVYLGELRTDDMGRLLFLGGTGASAPFRPGYNPVTFANNNGWHDDVCDGPVSATLTFKDNSTMAAEPGYVATTPPNFAQGLFGLVTMDDTVRETFVDQGWIAKPTSTSFTRDVWPIFDRLTGMQWVDQGLYVLHGTGSALDARDPGVLGRMNDSGRGHGDWRKRVFALFRDPNKDDSTFVNPQLPQIFGDAYGEVDDKGDDHLDSRTYLSVTKTQYAHLANWASDNYASDWQGIPSVPRFETLAAADQIAQLERAALHDCLGGAFHPGIELTWTMRLPGVWRGPYRLNILQTTAPAVQDYGDTLTPDVCIAKAYDGVAAGALTRFMGVPWQTDGTSCNSLADYARWTYLSMPTFWGARVPDQVLSLSDYARAADLDPTVWGVQIQKHFAQRADWLRDVRGRDYFARLQNMIAFWAKLGMVLPPENPPAHLPADTRVELGRTAYDGVVFDQDPKYQLTTAVETLDQPVPPAPALKARAAAPGKAKPQARHFKRGEV